MKYQTKKVIIEARIFDEREYHSRERSQRPDPYFKDIFREGVDYKIHTKQREVVVHNGDYLITYDGEQYPCNPETFHKKYEPVKEDSGSQKK